jgi:hypothetical protein
MKRKPGFLFIGLLLVTSITVTAQGRVLAVNESFSFSVIAKERFNNSGLKLIKGHTYLITATGTWKDGSCQTTDAAGFTSGECNSSVPGTYLLLKNTEHLRRDKNQNWFCLVGELFDQGSNVFDNMLADQQFRIGKSRTITPAISGKLVCFANDVITVYANNTGSVRVTVKRIS